jgi:hypothetical protein
MAVAVGDVAGELHTMKSAGYTFLWNRSTHERSVFNDNALAAKIAEQFPADHPTMAGQFAWTATEPSTPAPRGTTMCWLHTDRPERAKYDIEGYPVCDTDHFRNEFDAALHVEHKHKDVYLMITKQQEQDRLNNAGQANTEAITMLAQAIAGGTLTLPSAATIGELGGSVDGGDIWDYTITADTPATQTINVSFDEVPRHVHRYPKAMGSACNHTGCTAVRETPFAKRNKK